MPASGVTARAVSSDHRIDALHDVHYASGCKSVRLPCSFTHSLACSLAHSLTHSPSHSPTKISPTNSLSHLNTFTHTPRQTVQFCLGTDLLVGGAGLDGQDPCVGGCQGPVHGGQAVHVLWSVLQHAVPPVAVLGRVHRHGLKPPPA
jgi:hypothetical protein